MLLTHAHIDHSGRIPKLYKDGFGIKVSDGEIVVTEMQLEGKNKMEAKNFINGYKNLVGKVLN